VAGIVVVNLKIKAKSSTVTSVASAAK